MGTPQHRMNRWESAGWLRWVGAALLLLGTFAHAMTAPLDHNEHMYLSAAILARDYTLYTDFAFLQMPYFPLLTQLFFSATSTEYYVLWGRIWSWGLTGTTAVMLLLVLRGRVGTTWVAWSVLPLFLLNQTLLKVQSESSNYVLPMAASVLAFVLIAPVLEGRVQPCWQTMGAGLALALATGTKLYYLVCFVPFGLVLLAFPREKPWWERVVGQCVPFMFGGIVGMVPISWFLLRDPQAFWFNNVGYHTTNALWRAQQEFPGMGMVGKLKFLFRLVFATPSNLIIPGMAIMGWILVLEWCSSQLRGASDGPGMLAPTTLLSLLLALMTFAAALVPSPVMIQYFAMPLPFMLLFLCGISARLESRDARRRHVILLTVLLGVTVVFGGKSLGVTLWQCIHPERWEGIAIHRASQELRAIVGEGRKMGGRIATLSPLYALESGLTIYPELATGPFLYRVGDLLDDPQRFKGTSPTRICAFLMGSPPDAIVVGFEDEAFLEQPLHACAEQMGYVPYPQWLRGRGIIYLPPSPPSHAP